MTAVPRSATTTGLDPSTEYGSTSSTFTPTSGAVGEAVFVRVIASAQGYTSATEVSADSIPTGRMGAVFGGAPAR
jgi:hypothetical protein